MNLRTFLSTIADSSNEIDRLIFLLIHRDVRQRGPALRRLLHMDTPAVEERLFALLRAINDTYQDDPSNSEDRGIFVDEYFLKHVLLWRGRAAFPSLLAALDDSAFLVRNAAVYVLSKLGDPGIFPAIFRMLMNDPFPDRYDCSALFALATPQHLNLLLPPLIQNPVQRHVAVNFLRGIGPAVASSVLPLLAEQDVEVRRIAVELLGEAGSPEVIDALTVALHDTDAGVRSQAVNALRLLNAQQALPALVEMVNDTDDNVRIEVIIALKSLDGPELFEMHIATLQHPDADIRAKAIEGLYGDIRAVEPLIIIALHDPDAKIRFSAIAALYRFGNHHAVDPLIIALTDPDIGIRVAAAYWLGELGDSKAVEALIAAFAASVASQKGDREGTVDAGFPDANDELRERIIHALCKIGDPGAIDMLITALDDASSYVCSSAIRGLAELGDQRAVAPLLKRLFGKHDTDVAEALGSLGGLQAIEGLYSVLLDVQKYPEYLRRSVAQALRQLQQPAPQELFSRLCHAEPLEKRNETAMILGILGDLHAFTPLLTLLNDTQEDPSVRCVAAHALHVLDNEQAIEPLIAILARDSSRVVRAQAAHVLAGSQQPAVFTALLNALADEAPIVRVVAVTSLQSFNDPQLIPILQQMMKREVARDDDFVDYFADTMYLHILMIESWLPEEWIQNAINYLQA